MELEELFDAELAAALLWEASVFAFATVPLDAFSLDWTSVVLLAAVPLDVVAPDGLLPVLLASALAALVLSTGLSVMSRPSPVVLFEPFAGISEVEVIVTVMVLVG